MIKELYKLNKYNNDEYYIIWCWWVNYCKCMTKWDNEKELEKWCDEVLAR